MISIFHIKIERLRKVKWLQGKQWIKQMIPPLLPSTMAMKCW